MGKEYIPLFLDFNETTQDLSDDECGRLIRAIIEYANDREYESILTGSEKIAFRFLKGVVDRNQAISEARAKAGASKSKCNQMQSNENKSEQNESKSLTKTKNKKENKNKNENKDNKQNEAFEQFWIVYPRHEAKQTAQKAFTKLDPDETLLQTMIQAVEKQKASPQWQENGGQFIPYPATWLNGRRWEDQVQGGTQAKKVTAQQYPQREQDIPQETPEEMLERLFSGGRCG